MRHFAHGGDDGLLAEAVSNRYLRGAARLDERAESRLRQASGTNSTLARARPEPAVTRTGPLPTAAVNPIAASRHWIGPALPAESFGIEQSAFSDEPITRRGDKRTMSD
jgi:hypothetical protein